jgi:hypothetical protein
MIASSIVNYLIVKKMNGQPKSSQFGEHFESESNQVTSAMNRSVDMRALADLITSIVVTIIVLVLVGFVSSHVWNSVVAGNGVKATGLFTTVKTSDWWQMLQLYFIVSLFLS